MNFKKQPHEPCKEFCQHEYLKVPNVNHLKQIKHNRQLHAKKYLLRQLHEYL